MSRGALIVDMALAVVLTVLIVVLAPGWAVVGLLGALIVLICALSFAVEARRRRRGRRRGHPRGRGEPAPRRRPRGDGRLRAR